LSTIARAPTRSLNPRMHELYIHAAAATLDTCYVHGTVESHELLRILATGREGRRGSGRAGSTAGLSTPTTYYWGLTANVGVRIS
jgi:hypothetical protein